MFLDPKTEDTSTTIRYIKNILKRYDLIELSEALYAIEEAIEDGSKEAKTTSSRITDLYFMEYLKSKFSRFSQRKTEEKRFRINNQTFEFKKIYGKSRVEFEQLEDNSKTPVMILNMKAEQWWDEKPEVTVDDSLEDADWTKEIPRGIYMIESDEFKQWRNLSTYNIECDESIVEQFLYVAIRNAKERENYMELPEATGAKRFSVTKGVQWK